MSTAARPMREYRLRRHRGNPDWRSGGEFVPMPAARLTEFEKLLNRLGIHVANTDEPDKESRARMLRSTQVREFARRNYTRRYVPEWLLAEMVLQVLDFDLYLQERYARGL